MRRDMLCKGVFPMECSLFFGLLPAVYQVYAHTGTVSVNGDAPESYRGQSVDEKSLFCSTMGRCQLSIHTCSRHLSAAICRGCGLHSPFSWWLTAEISN